MKRRKKGQNSLKASKTVGLNCLALFRVRENTGLQVSSPLFPSTGFDSRGSLGTGGSASAWGNHHSFASQRIKMAFIPSSEVGFASPILSSLFLLPSPSPPPLPVGRERKGGRGRRTHRSQAAEWWDSLSLAFTSQWGSGCYWFSLVCERVLLA